MGRKRWWRGGLELLVLCILHRAILGDGNVGCLFSENLCDSRTETCYNDLAFGKCVPLYAYLDGEGFYQYNLDTEELELLRLQLERLEGEGYKWSHPYTQCIMQTSLYNFRHGLKQDFRLCHHLKEYDERRFEDRENVGSRDFRPVLNANPQDVLLNRIYYIPDVPNDFIQYMPNEKEIEYLPTYSIERPKEIIQQNHRPKYPFKYPIDDYNSARDGDRFYDPTKKLRKKSLTLNEVGEQLYPSVRHRHKSENYFDRETPFEDFDEEDSLNEPSWQAEERPQAGDKILSDNLEFLPVDAVSRQVEETLEKNLGADPVDQYERIFSRKYKHPKRLSSIEYLSDKSEDSLPENSDEKESDAFKKDDDYENVNEEETEPELEKSNAELSSNEKGIYAEGGLAQPLAYAVEEQDEGKEDENPYGVLLDDDLNELLWRRELAGFKRRERLDVKKPGPLFSTNNYAFKTQSPSTISEDKVTEEKDQDEILVPSVVKKKLNSNEHGILEGYRNVDMDHVYIVFRQNLGKWKAGKEVIQKVGTLLGLNPGSLTDVRIGRAEVTFKVAENDKNYNATDVANSIDAIRDKLKEDLGVEVLYAGIGDKIKLPPSLDVSSESEVSSSYFGAILAAAIAAAGAAAAVTLVIARRHAKSREKLAGLATPDPEASKDYQDLCRARMQAKQPSDKPESPRVPKSRDSESNNSPSNRSSTSSWTEEPSLLNMDISTGHMVLSYMEDHLKNKDRLDQEWAALCAYEADPSSTEIAENETNRKYNRPGVALPYDHSRIVLNDLANANSCDYINASTITDHDPRNPAYIATQGPLPHTTADFWQLVWEQGSVVIVMLTRLTEEGRAMCHRYWPEEGSELYHIYEVHLVSEHFWCDDYLVRSFYLKNLRTGETRTVTQFHFLSWPENSVPHSTKALLEFRRKVNKSYRGRSCPIVVHCSDGAGRTGTYCLIDMVLNRMAKGAKEIDIAATLEHIRDQRPDMVATKLQFEFVLMAVAEEVHAILKALPVPPTEKQPTGTGGGSVPTTKSDH